MVCTDDYAPVTNCSRLQADPRLPGLDVRLAPPPPRSMTCPALACAADDLEMFVPYSMHSRPLSLQPDMPLWTLPFATCLALRIQRCRHEAGHISRSL